MTAIREARARAQEAARLRGCRYTWQAIADHLGYRSRQAAFDAVERYYARQRETPEATRRSLVEGLDLVTTNLFERFATAKAEGNTSMMLALSSEIRLVTDQHAKLNGLHAAQKVDVNVTQTRVEILADLRRNMLEAIASEPDRPAIAATMQPITEIPSQITR